MPHLRLHDASYALPLGEARVGWSEDAEVRLPGTPASAGVGIVSVSDDGRASVRPASPDVAVLVNGVPVGREAAPLLHGDRLTINGCELRFADEAMSGDTGEVPALVSTFVAVPSAGVLEARSKGRLVSLVDGREYPVGPAGLLIGRDAGCDVVIATPHVSRRHARIDARPEGGFVLTDMGRQGTLVNDGRVEGEVTLGRGDAIQVGGEMFRFWAEAAPTSAPRSIAEVPQLQRTGAIASAKRPAALATLEVLNHGPTRGARFDLFAPLSNVGRGAYNDVSISDDSVSEFHAKIQRRDDGWYVVDMGSTNGTYVNGTRVFGEASLRPGSDVRFGGVKLAFRTAGAPHQNGGETRVIVGLRAPDPQRVGGEAGTPAAPQHAERSAAAQAPTEKKGSILPWLLLASLGAIFLYLVLQGR